MHYDHDLAKNNTLTVARESMSFFQEHIGSLLRVSHDTVSRYERGNRMPSLPVAIGLELIFGQSLAELYPSLARAVADQMVPVLQRLSIQMEANEQAHANAVAAIRTIGDRLSSMTPEA